MEKVIFTTNTFKNGNLKNREKLITLKEYIEYDRLKVGQKIYLCDIKIDEFGRECATNSIDIIVGDCTPYIQPTENDGGIGWNLNDELCQKYITEIHLL